MIEEKKRGPKPGWEITPEVIKEIKGMAGLMTQEQMWNYFGVGKDTWYDRKSKYPEMDEAIKMGSSKKILYVASKLMNEIENGNVAAMIFFLKTQGRWAEHSKVQVTETPKKELPTTLGADPITASQTYQKIMGE